jgi:ubiquinone/menaquinone biosynthesis C-methylase UbiE
MADRYIALSRWAFERFYREFAWTYDAVAAAVSWGRWQDWILTALPLLHGDVLEVGCGTGNLQRALAGRPAIRRVVGLDLSQQMLTLARRKAPQARLTRADVRRLPFPGAAFDCVVATFPSEYIADPQALAEIARILRPGGQLQIVLGAQLAGPAIYRRIIALAYRLVRLQPPAPASAPARGAAPRMLAALEQAGLAAHDTWVAAPGGAVYRITAERSLTYGCD